MSENNKPVRDKEVLKDTAVQQSLESMVNLDLDYHQVKASEHFNISYENVTKEQRKFAKLFYGMEAYSSRLPLNEEQLHRLKELAAQSSQYGKEHGSTDSLLAGYGSPSATSKPFRLTDMLNSTSTKDKDMSSDF